MNAILTSNRPLIRVSLADMVYENLLEAIVNGRLARGTELNEVSVAEQLQVSRTPVHEALRRLAADGLVEQLANRRVRVAQFGRRELEEIYELRAILESAACRRAATKMEAQHVKFLRDSADALEKSMGSADWPQRAIEFDQRFHEAIAAGSGNEHLRKDILRYRRLVQAFCRLTGSVENLREAFREHLKILSALEAHDADAAALAMSEHVMKRMRVVVEKAG
jgi:DNA-binding GntR family transcriptional regulator